MRRGRAGVGRGACGLLLPLRHTCCCRAAAAMGGKASPMEGSPCVSRRLRANGALAAGTYLTRTGRNAAPMEGSGWVSRTLRPDALEGWSHMRTSAAKKGRRGRDARRLDVQREIEDTCKPEAGADDSAVAVDHGHVVAGARVHTGRGLRLDERVLLQLHLGEVLAYLASSSSQLRN
ncbi:hypothetical protein DFH09DRAFT_1234050 [Mycena vulgaris]|nr:hypothetical protein DFH09DRAFT_1234050 [Mycena vulgaris]